jgi:phosphoribosylglycinamide formyltransferase-1
MADSHRVPPFILGILASHAGTNFQSILDRCLTGEIPATVGIVVSNNSRSGAIKRAQRIGISTHHLSSATHPDPEGLDRSMTEVLCDHRVDLVVLAGYMKKLGPGLLRTFRDRVINVHPSLLPAFGGQSMFGARVHKSVLKSGCRMTGVSVHVVDEEYDHGQVIAQETVPVIDGDTTETLAQRVLEMEHRLYPSVVRNLAQGRIRIDNGRVIKVV